jgi:hypothetical protein
VAIDSRVTIVENVALPFADEHTFGCFPFISAVWIDRSWPSSRPANDFDLNIDRVGNDIPVTG